MADRAEVNLEITHDNILAGYSSAGVGVDHTSAMTDAFLEYLTVTICSGGNDVSFDIHHSFITSVSSNDTWSSEHTTGPGLAPPLCISFWWRGLEMEKPAYCHTEKKAP